MALTDTNGNGMVMPVAPMMNPYGYNMGMMNGMGMNGGFGWGNDWWLIIFFVLFCCNGNWGNNGNGNGGGGMYPYMITNNTSADLQRGFDQQALVSGINGVNNAVNNLGSQICEGFAGSNLTVNQGFANAEIANNSRQMANMQQNFNAQTAITGGLCDLSAQIAKCCCDDQLATSQLQSIIVSEDAATRVAINNVGTNLTANNTANTQRIVDEMNAGFRGIFDQLCQMKIEAKDETINNLQRQLSAADTANQIAGLKASLLADNSAQTIALEQYFNPAARYCAGNWSNYFNGGCNQCCG